MSHDFYIPVMGTGFTADSPLKIARYGISSVISLVDDILLEQLGTHHAAENGIDWETADPSAPDCRATRIRNYLNLLDTLVNRQIAAMKEERFGSGGDLDKAFDLLPDGEVRERYLNLRNLTRESREKEEAELKALLKPGAIDVNIMTKLDRIPSRNGEQLESIYSDAQTALKGFAESSVVSSVILSAGINPRLFTAMEQYRGFQPNAPVRKGIILKVSDFRSAIVQGTQLARKALWVDEYRIESGINCGGHTFIGKGQPMGPVLEEFASRRDELREKVMAEYAKAAEKKGYTWNEADLPTRICAQGGIGSTADQRILRDYYQIDLTGWGSPFLLVPEATTMDDESRELLSRAKKDDVFLSESSPLGVPFWMLKGTRSENLRLKRIADGKPGAPCVKGFLALNQDFGPAALCTASKTYISKRLKEIETTITDARTRVQAIATTLAKACICHDLGGGATLSYGIDEKANPTVTPGPGVVGFEGIFSLKEMVDHIYGRIDLFLKNGTSETEKKPPRQSMFLSEMELYIKRLTEEIQSASSDILEKTGSHLNDFAKNLSDGIVYYREKAGILFDSGAQFAQVKLDELSRELEGLKGILSTNIPQAS